MTRLLKAALSKKLKEISDFFLSNEAACTLLAVGHYSLKECLKRWTALPRYHLAPHGHLEKWIKSLVVVARIKTVW